MSNYTDLKIFNYDIIEKKPKIIIRDYETFFDIHYNTFMNTYNMKRKDIPDDFQFLMEIYNSETFQNVFQLSFIDVFVWLSFKGNHKITVNHNYITHIELVANVFNCFDNILVYAHVNRRKWCC